MPTCSQAKIITNLESDIHKRFIKLSSKDCDSNNIFHNYETTYNDSNECFYSIGNKVNNIETNDPKFNEQKNQFCSDYCKSNSTLTKSVNNQPKVNYYTQNYYNQFFNMNFHNCKFFSIWKINHYKSKSNHTYLKNLGLLETIMLNQRRLF